jgi:hypothetical protein
LGTSGKANAGRVPNSEVPTIFSVGFLFKKASSKNAKGKYKERQACHVT